MLQFFVFALVFPAIAYSQLATIQCTAGYGPRSEMVSEFEEGIDDYIVRLRMSDNPRGLVESYTVGEDGPLTVQEYEIRFPKVIEGAELKPGCLLAAQKAPLLFNCKEGTVRPKVKITEMRTFTSVEKDISDFKIQAWRFKRRAGGVREPRKAEAYVWAFQGKIDGKQFADKLEFEKCEAAK